MQTKDLEVFDLMPFYFWAKDEQGRYLWANRAVREFAQEEMVGKTDFDLTWSDSAKVLREADDEVFATGQPRFLIEQVGQAEGEKTAFSVCKTAGELNGQKCTFGLAFAVE